MRRESFRRTISLTVAHNTLVITYVCSCSFLIVDFSLPLSYTVRMLVATARERLDRLKSQLRDATKRRAAHRRETQREARAFTFAAREERDETTRAQLLEYLRGYRAERASEYAAMSEEHARLTRAVAGARNALRHAQNEAYLARAPGSRREARLAYGRAYRAKHPEKVRAYNQAYRARHPEAIKERAAEYRALHADELREKAALYYGANWDKYRKYQQKWRARKRAKAANT